MSPALKPVYIGVSTCLWRGIHVRDVLIASGLQDQPDHERWYLHIEGAAAYVCLVSSLT